MARVPVSCGLPRADISNWHRGQLGLHCLVLPDDLRPSHPLIGERTIGGTMDGQGLNRRKIDLIRPPHAAEKAVRENCSGCKACITACPEGILIAGRANTPVVVFNKGSCVFCGACAEACSEAVYDLSATAWGHVAEINESCFLQHGVTCQSCRDACETEALKFEFRLGIVGTILVNEEVCTGCGGCLAVCPTGAIDLVSIG